MIIGLFVALGSVTVLFVVTWYLLARKSGTRIEPEENRHAWYHAVAGFVFSFFDTLGIGCFAPTTSAFKLRGSVPDEKIPGTLNIGYALPTIAQAFIYITFVQVDELTLVLLIAASVLGAWLGAGIVARWPRRNIQIGMGFALLAAACFFLMKQLKIGPEKGDTIGLEGTRLWLGLAGNFALGALMTLGIGLYAPCLILVSLLGMNEKSAFPIMMGSCAFLMPIGGIRFIRTGSYSLGAALVITVSALPAVFLAAYVVKEMELETLRWLIIVVVATTAALMLRSAFFDNRSPAPPDQPVA